MTDSERIELLRFALAEVVARYDQQVTREGMRRRRGPAQFRTDPREIHNARQVLRETKPPE